MQQEETPTPMDMMVVVSDRVSTMDQRLFCSQRRGESAEGSPAGYILCTIGVQTT